MTEAPIKGSIPGPKLLPGIEGFYLLTASGELGRYGSDGEFALETELSRALADKIDILLQILKLKMSFYIRKSC